MVKMTVGIDGMACNMCEAHVNEAIRKAFPGVSKVTSDHKKGETVILSDGELSREALEQAVGATGYRVLSLKTEPWEKKGLFGRKG